MKPLYGFFLIIIKSSHHKREVENEEKKEEEHGLKLKPSFPRNSKRVTVDSD
jgi:hypothetical protein